MKYLNSLLCVFSVFIIVGCAPIYNTSYSYIPPKSQVGIMCVSNCDNNVNNCRHIEELKKDNCEYRADLDYDHCVKDSEHESRQNSSSHHHTHHCYRKSCQANYEHCTSDYNRCYQACGGSVTTTQQCVAFCK